MSYRTPLFEWRIGFAPFVPLKFAGIWRHSIESSRAAVPHCAKLGSADGPRAPRVTSQEPPPYPNLIQRSICETQTLALSCATGPMRRDEK